MDLSKFTTSDKFLMLALDHRGSFKKLMNPKDSDSVTTQQVILLKSEIINSLKYQFSGLLIDQTYGLQAYDLVLHELDKASPGELHDSKDDKPFLLPVEKTGYTDKSGERLTELEYSAEQIMGMGALGVKLLLYFNPTLPSSEDQVKVAVKVFNDCKDHAFPLFLEIVTYLPGEGDLAAERPQLVVKSLEKLMMAGVVPEVFKLEYPGNLEACQEITKLLGTTPWILLTRGDDFETFKKELEEAVSAGCQGFLAGRALWQEVCTMSGDEKQHFLSQTLPERFKIISDIALQ